MAQSDAAKTINLYGLNAQFWAIVAAAIILGGLVLQQSNGIRTEIGTLRNEIIDLRERMTKVETTLDLIVRGLHIEVKTDPS